MSCFLRVFGRLPVNSNLKNYFECEDYLMWAVADPGFQHRGGGLLQQLFTDDFLSFSLSLSLPPSLPISFYSPSATLGSRALRIEAHSMGGPPIAGRPQARVPWLPLNPALGRYGLSFFYRVNRGRPPPRPPPPGSMHHWMWAPFVRCRW